MKFTAQSTSATISKCSQSKTGVKLLKQLCSLASVVLLNLLWGILMDSSHLLSSPSKSLKNLRSRWCRNFRKRRDKLIWVSTCLVTLSVTSAPMPWTLTAITTKSTRLVPTPLSGHPSSVALKKDRGLQPKQAFGTPSKMDLGIKTHASSEESLQKNLIKHTTTPKTVMLEPI